MGGMILGVSHHPGENRCATVFPKISFVLFFALLSKEEMLLCYILKLFCFCYVETHDND